MIGQGGAISGGRELDEVTHDNPRLGSLLSKVIDGINRLSINSAISPSGDIPAPSSPNSVSVKVSGELMHISINHNDPNLSRNIRYFSEISPNSNTFGQPLVIDHGSSRTSSPINLPTYQDDGSTYNNYYVRSYAQYPGSPPSNPTVVGGIGSPTAFKMSGSTNLTLLPSTGSGTAPNSGQSAGQGLGKTVFRHS